MLDTGVLVSALLNPTPGGASFDLLRLARERRFELHLSPSIIEETACVLLTRKRIREGYLYSDGDVAGFCNDLISVAVMQTDIPIIQVVRDPEDDLILACALAARADYLVSRDKDLLSIGEYLRNQDHHAGVVLGCVAESGTIVLILGGRARAARPHHCDGNPAARPPTLLKRSLVSSECGPGDQRLATTCRLPRRGGWPELAAWAKSLARGCHADRAPETILPTLHARALQSIEICSNPLRFNRRLTKSEPRISFAWHGE